MHAAQPVTRLERGDAPAADIGLIRALQHPCRALETATARRHHDNRGTQIGEHPGDPGSHRPGTDQATPTHVRPVPCGTAHGVPSPPLSHHRYVTAPHAIPAPTAGMTSQSPFWNFPSCLA